MPPDPTIQELDEVRAMLASLTDYKVEAVLGSGAMGKVVLVRHKKLGRRAMKLINQGLQQSGYVRRRFDNEATIMGALQHPHVVTVHALHEVSGTSCIEMEFLEGGTLLDHLDTFAAMPERQAVEVTLAILSALEAAHSYTDEQGKLSPIIHRDIKIENVLLTKRGIPKVADFGIAHLEGGTRQLTREGTTIGTPIYMSPEQREGRSIDLRTDLYAVGVLLYILLRAPKSFWKVAFHEAWGKHPDMFEGMSGGLAQVVKTATREEASDRFLHTQAMESALRTLLPSLPENPEDTPKLGMAPGVARERKAKEMAALSALLPIPIQEAGSISPTHAPVSVGDSSSGGLSNHTGEARVSHVPPSVRTSSRAEVRVQNPWGSGTLHGGETHSGAAFEHELDQARHAAKRRFFVGLGITCAIVVIVGGSLWYLDKIDGQEDSSTIASPSPAPVTEVPPAPKAEVVPAEIQPITTPTSAPVVETPVVKTHKKAVKAVTVVAASEVAPMQNAHVRLILKEETVATVVLIGEAGTFTLSGADTSAMVPPGTYKATVQMEGRDGTPQTGTLTVTPGITTMTCTARFKKCTGIK